MDDTNQRPIIVISAINLRMGGGLTILRECLEYLSQSKFSRDYRIIALVHKRDLAYFPNIDYIEYPKSASNWIRRLYYEYFDFNKLSKKLQPYLWLSLHDITPRIKAKHQAVYMHNPSIVNKIKASDWKFDKTYIAFSLFYKYIYRINLHRNDYCIVQQNWFREVCSNRFKIPLSKMIVAKPHMPFLENTSHMISHSLNPCLNFFYPSVPRPFKNFETLCEAATIIEKKRIYNVKITLTLDGTENKYAKSIYEKYKHCNLIKFTGLLNKTEMESQYFSTDCLIFPSRLETWGLPISEFLPLNKPMIIADEPYAHETAQGASSVAYFPSNNPNVLANLIIDLVSGNYSKFEFQPVPEISDPSASNFNELFKILLSTK